jgi:hypothetical protein
MYQHYYLRKCPMKNIIKNEKKKSNKWYITFEERKIIEKMLLLNI